MLQGYAALARETIIDRQMQDFGIFYRSTRQYIAGQSLYANPGVSAGSGFRNLNLPHLHLGLLGFAWLSPGWALAIWCAGSAFALGDATRRTWRATRLRLPWLGALALPVYVLGWAPTAATVLTGQVGVLLMWPVALAWLASRRGSWRSAGAWIGLAASVKPFLLLALPYFAVRRRWDALGYTLLVLITTFVVGATVFGLDEYRRWIWQLPDIRWGGHYMNASLLGVTDRWLGRGTYYKVVLRAPDWVIPAGLLGSCLVCVVTFARVRPSSQGAATADREWSSWLLASLLMSPLGWVYYLWIALLPVTLVVAEARPWSRRSPRDGLLIVGLGSLLWSGSMSTWGQPSAWATITTASMYVWALLSFWSWTIREQTQANAASRATAAD